MNELSRLLLILIEVSCQITRLNSFSLDSTHSVLIVSVNYIFFTRSVHQIKMKRFPKIQTGRYLRKGDFVVSHNRVVIVRLSQQVCCISSNFLKRRDRFLQEERKKMQGATINVVSGKIPHVSNFFFEISRYLSLHLSRFPKLSLIQASLDGQAGTLKLASIAWSTISALKLAMVESVILRKT